MQPMTYEEAIAFIHGAYGIGKKNGLENMRRMLALLGHPERAFPSVHVGGTNGKGSVCAMIQAGLRCSGYRTGLYTSPFLQRYNERMRIDGIPISDALLARYTAQVAEVVATLRAEGIHPTEFEIGTAVAFAYLAAEQVDIAVIEVGLGGQIDPTNVVIPEVSVITVIGLDHTRVLGDTLAAIAGNKAGIIKQGIPLVLSAQNEASVRQVIEDRCRAVGAPFVLAPFMRQRSISLAGAHQQYNAAVAEEALHQLHARGWRQITDEAIDEGIRRARWPGRLEWMQTDPPILLDGAHNPQGAQALAAYLRTQPFDHIALICGVMRDKSWEDMARALAPVADSAFCVRPESHRALPPETLQETFSSLGVPAETCGSIDAALSQARESLRQDGNGCIVIAGSLYLVGEARTLLLGPDDTLLS